MTTTRADVAIIGGGVIGLSIAAQLRRMSSLSIVVLERGGDHSQGSTSRATGGFRAQFGSTVNIALSLRSRQMLETFRDDHGIDPGFQRAGYLFLAQSEAAMSQLRLANELQRTSGVAEAQIVSAAECARIQPLIEPSTVVGGAFSPSDGFIQPLSILSGYRASCVRLGVSIVYDAEVVGCRRGDERVTSVSLRSGDIVEAETFVNAAGAWATDVGTLLGEFVPVVASKRQVAVTVHSTDIAAGFPMTIVADDGWHTRSRDGRILLLLPRPAQDENTLSVEAGWLQRVSERTARVAPSLATIAIDRDRCWAGYYEVSPDGHAILGRGSKTRNLFLANGSSGHGVMHSPAIGEAVAQMIIGTPTSVDVSALSPDRFMMRRPVESIDLL